MRLKAPTKGWRRPGLSHFLVPAHIQEYLPFHHGSIPSGIVVRKVLAVSVDLLKRDSASKVSEKQMLQKAKHDKHAWEKGI